ncbi:IclR family transcriptional regulator [Pseudorhodoplanes sp.]|uniref:IclR family transcriptional regulator n=1 Tax=Pseudorhodoplanes sp. TaxID=1934341 RepID=UPI002C811999|nr:helix-turn-helix domain-containing protein [Pseudorhodoplanes sp.]HWV53669.1 helix-turn-helix domain-containing protein [Pseudorhodoplanes sp.]
MTSSTAKSAQRAFEILELFGERRTPLSVMDVVRALDYPQSSTSMLLKGLHAFGYLNYDSRQRRYSPTARVALLGAQITRGFFFSGDLAKLAYDLQARTGEEVLFGMQNGVHVQYIQTLESPAYAMPFHHRSGTLRPIGRTATGKMLLSLKSNTEIGALVRRINANDRKPSVNLTVLLAEIEAIRECGYAVCHEEATPGASGLGMLMPPLPDHPPIAIGIAGRTERIRARQSSLIDELREAVQGFAEQSGKTGGASERQRPGRGNHAGL